MSAAAQPAWVPTLPADTFANRLRLLRLADGDSSVLEMAAKCGIPVPTWRTWEHGALPRDMPKVVRQIHDATGVDMAWLMWGTGPDTPPGQEFPVSLCMSDSDEGADVVDIQSRRGQVTAAPVRRAS